MTVEMRLKDNMDVARGKVDKDASAVIHVGVLCLAKSREQSAVGAANEMIHQDALSRLKVISLQCSLLVSNNRGFLARRKMTTLLPKLTSSTFWKQRKFGVKQASSCNLRFD